MDLVDGPQEARGPGRTLTERNLCPSLTKTQAGAGGLGEARWLVAT